jgi:hypothetical protein
MATDTRARQLVRLGDRKPDPGSIDRQQLVRDVQEAEASFRRAVVEDWPNAMVTFFEWTDARHRLNAASTEPVFVDIPKFSELVQQISYQAAIRRNAS